MPRAETVDTSSWLLTACLGARTMCICERDGVWSVIVDGPAATSRSFDEALLTALRVGSPAEGPRNG